MRLSFELTIVSLLCLQPSAASANLARRDADFESVRTRLDKSFVDPQPKHPLKYFHESILDAHYDGRFADRPLKYDEKQKYLTFLIRTYLSTMGDIGIETWLMHGTLLGWYWNRKNMPWDSDLDVMVSESSILFLATYYNMTIHHFKSRGSKTGRKYLLEINPHCRESQADNDNRIDARWIDTDNGLFIDITTLRRNHTAAALGEDDAMMVKDNHHYVFDDIYPLRDSEFEGMPVLVPFAYPAILMEEYGDDALSNVYHNNHHFDVAKNAWVPQKMAVLSPGYSEQTV